MNEELKTYKVLLHCVECGDIESEFRSTDKSVELFKDRDDVLFEVHCPKCGRCYALPLKRLKILK